MYDGLGKRGYHVNENVRIRESESECRLPLSQVYCTVKESVCLVRNDEVLWD
jgi:hypothetical protein